ncbi:MAG: mechanosensitive ion channel family protein [Candidatus Nanohaloarchaea archaeon]
MPDLLSSFMNSSFGFADFSVEGSTFFLAAAVILGAFVANRLSNYIIGRSVERRSDQHVSVTAKKISSYVIYSVGFVVLLGVFGLPLSALGTAVGLIGLGLSFALKDIIANCVSGLLIMISRPFKIGDQIEVQGESGTVENIKIRATDIRTFDGRKIIVPNSVLYNGTVKNNTAYDERRFDVIVGVGYDESIEEAKELAIETLEEVDSVDFEPEPQVLVEELGGSSVNLKLRGWTKPSRASMVDASSQVTQLVKEKYDEAGIDIPYPIRTVYMNEE